MLLLAVGQLGRRPSKDCCKMIPGPLSMLLLVICNSVKMGIHLCYKWDKPKAMVKVEENYSSIWLELT